MSTSMHGTGRLEPFELPPRNGSIALRLRNQEALRRLARNDPMKDWRKAPPAGFPGPEQSSVTPLRQAQTASDCW